MTKGGQELTGLVWNLAELLDRVDNDQDLLRDLLNIFKEDFPRTMRSLESAVAAADLKNASRLSHSLKGMLSSLSGMRAAAAAGKLEVLATAGETASLKGPAVENGKLAFEELCKPYSTGLCLSWTVQEFAVRFAFDLNKPKSI